MKTNRIILAIAALALCACGKTTAPQLTKSGINPEDFNGEVNGQKVALYQLTNANGVEVCITNFGGRIVSIMVPDKDGNFQDVVHGFSTLNEYLPENNKTDFGAAIGRYANRINQGRFTLDGVEYQLPQNNYGHCLHGGPQGWQYQVYDVVEADATHLKIVRNSPDGDANFPGAVTAYVTYTLTDDNALDIQYEATSDAPTIINLTNHSYFNLSGDPANHFITDDILWINASNFTPVDDTFMTSGEIAPVAGTPMDFTTPKQIGLEIDADYQQLKNGLGYDHNWVLDTNCDVNQKAAEVTCPASGIVMSVYTNEPGIQVYCGNFLDSTVTGKKGVVYARRTAICLETQHYPDTPNKPEWPSAVLRPGDTYKSQCIYKFSVQE